MIAFMTNNSSLNTSVTNGLTHFDAQGQAHMVDVATDGYLREGKRFATLAIGCTGGKHRSVAMAENLAARLLHVGLEVTVVHRDLGREWCLPPSPSPGEPPHAVALWPQARPSSPWAMGVPTADQHPDIPLTPATTSV